MAPVLSLVGDITSYGDMQQAAARVQERWGRTDHVVHAAAIGSGKYGFPFWNLEPSDWGRVLEVNVVGAANVAHAFAPAPSERAPRGLGLGEPYLKAPPVDLDRADVVDRPRRSA